MKYLLNIKFDEENKSLINIYWIYYKKRRFSAPFQLFFQTFF